MSLIVQKFGGSSVRDHEHLLRMARIVKGNVDRGDEVLVVLSAQGDTTDGLLQKAKEMSAAPSPRELDMLLSAGEQMSAALGAMTLRSIGVEAVSLCAWQIPIETDGTHGNAEIELIDTARIRKELAEGRVVVAAGFQGVDENGDITTLGRGGSDTSAVALAAALNENRLRGAGIDVLDMEPMKPNHPYLTAKNCYVTPHVAWASQEARTRLVKIAADNIKAFLSGSHVNQVNKL